MTLQEQKKQKPIYKISCKVSVINGITYYWDSHNGGVTVKVKTVKR
jgi:hypothetical protein